MVGPSQVSLWKFFGNHWSKIFLSDRMPICVPSLLFETVGCQEWHPACKKIALAISEDFPTECCDAVGWATGRISALVEMLGDGVLMVTIWLELCTSYSSSCHHHLHHSYLLRLSSNKKSRMKTYWYRLTHVVRKNGRLTSVVVLGLGSSLVWHVKIGQLETRERGCPSWWRSSNVRKVLKAQKGNGKSK